MVNYSTSRRRYHNAVDSQSILSSFTRTALTTDFPLAFRPQSDAKSHERHQPSSQTDIQYGLADSLIAHCLVLTSTVFAISFLTAATITVICILAYPRMPGMHYLNRSNGRQPGQANAAMHAAPQQRQLPQEVAGAAIDWSGREWQRRSESRDRMRQRCCCCKKGAVTCSWTDEAAPLPWACQVPHELFLRSLRRRRPYF